MGDKRIRLQKCLKKATAVVLVISMLWLLPIDAYGASASEDNETQKYSSGIEEKQPNILCEDSQKRDTYTKHFKLDDGSFMAVQYESPVNYKDKNGNWVEYDNTMVAENTASSDSTSTQDEALSDFDYSNKKSNIDIKFANKSKKNNMIKIKADGYQISWGYQNIEQKKIELLKNNEKLTGNDAFLTLKNVASESIYKDVFKNVDMQYFATSTGVKENIILKTKDAQNEFLVDYNIQGLTASLTDSNTIELKDKNNKVVYVIDAPYMTDAKGETSTQLSLQIVSQKNNKLTIKLTADKNWLNAWGREFPVTVDPQNSVIQSNTNTELQSGLIFESNPNTVYDFGPYLYLKNTAGGSMKALVKLENLPTMGAGDKIVSAKLNMYRYGSTPTGLTINAHEITSTWTPTTATWNNITYNSNVADYVTDNTDQNYKTWDITGLTKKWYKTGTNNGVVLDIATSSSTQIALFTSKQNISIYKPYLTLTYKNYKGTESNLTYHTHNVGVNATGSLCDYTGSLVYKQNIFEGTGSRMPVTIDMTYNSLLYDTTFGNGSPTGKGWQASFNKYIKSTSAALASAGYDYIYTDGDGTEHYFKKNTEDSNNVFWEDEDGLGLTLKLGSSSDTTTLDRLIMTNDSTTSTFELPANGGKILSETDNPEATSQNKNEIVYTYNSSGYLTNIKDGANRNYTFSYGYFSAANITALTQITAPDGKTAKFAYLANNKLFNVEFSDKTTTRFYYDANNRLIASRGIDISEANNDKYDAYVEYEYNAQGQVSKMNEKGSDGQNGNYITMTYNDDYTTQFTDRLGRTEKYTFDNYGNTVNVINANGCITSTSSDGLGVSSSSDSYTKNYIVNSNYPTSSQYTTSNGAIDGVTSAGGTVTFGNHSTDAGTDRKYYLGASSIKVNNTGSSQFFTMAKQNISATDLIGKKITFSAYVKTNEVAQGTYTGLSGAILKIKGINSSGTTVFEKNSNVAVTGTKDWQRISATSLVSVTSDVTEIIVYVGLRNAQGTAYFDCLQLEEGDCMNDYNGLEDSALTNTTSSQNNWLGSKIINSTATTVNSVKQGIRVDRSNVAFVLSANITGNTTPLTTESRVYGLKATIVYKDDLITEKTNHYQQFNPWTTSEQAVSMTVYPDYPSKEIQTIEFDIINQYNYGSITVNNTMLNFGEYYADDYVAPTTGTEETTTSEEPPYRYVYEYDNYGNTLKSTFGKVLTADDGTESIDTSLPYISTQTAYNSTGNYVTSETDARGKTVSYNVNASNGQINSVTDAFGDTQSYTYNSNNGNLTSVSGTINAGTVTNQYAYNSWGDFTAITHNGFSYNFQYDNFKNQTAALVGNSALITNNYDIYGKLTSSVYGNGDVISYTYDSYDRIISVKLNGSVTVSYIYNKKGMPVTVRDCNAATITEYIYDVWGSIVKSYDSFENSPLTYEKTYDSDGNVLEVTKLNDVERIVSETKNDDDATVTNNNGWSVYETKDSLNRTDKVITSRAAGAITPFSREYTYAAGNGTNATTELINGVTEKYGSTSLAQYTYTYDNNGCIDSVRKNGTLIEIYDYDELNQLTNVTDYQNNKSYVYTYDIGGNITSKKMYGLSNGVPVTLLTTDTYNYSTGEWKDQLTSYNGTAITYDAIGNPLSYRNNMTMSWTNGRQLSTITKGTKLYEYTYNANGMRTQKVEKTSGTVTNTTKYYYNDQNLLTAAEIPSQYGNNTLFFYYDENGSPVSVALKRTKADGVSTENLRYYYVKNLQGDIVGMADESGVLCVNYTYDAWGNWTSKTDGSGNTLTDKSNIGLLNPLRYRGYVYDTDTGLYYLQSRYYDPVTGRFINADVYMDTMDGILGTNMFAYCENNSINRIDPFGMLSSLVVKIIRSGRTTKCFIILYWVGSQLYSAWRFTKISVTNGNWIFPKTYATLKPHTRNQYVTLYVVAAAAGSVTLGVVSIPTNVTSARLEFLNVQGYNLSKAYWESAYIASFTGKIR